MANNIKIPVIKNSGLNLKKNGRRHRQTSPFTIFLVILASFTLMLSFVWLKIETNNVLTQSSYLKTQKEQIHRKNQKLRAEVEALKSLGAIQSLAESKLGLIFLPSDNIIKLSP